MKSENKIFKNNLINYFALLYCFSWIGFYLFNIWNFLFNHYKPNIEFKKILFVPIIIHGFIFVGFIITTIFVLKKSQKTFIFFNISNLLYIILLIFAVIYSYKIENFDIFKNKIFIRLVTAIIAISVVIFFINYFRINSNKNEIEDIGRNEKT